MQIPPYQLQTPTRNTLAVVGRVYLAFPTKILALKALFSLDRHPTLTDTPKPRTTSTQTWNAEGKMRRNGFHLTRGVWKA